jgi:hypothetical protein
MKAERTKGPGAHPAGFGVWVVRVISLRRFKQYSFPLLFHFCLGQHTAPLQFLFVSGCCFSCISLLFLVGPCGS